MNQEEEEEVHKCHQGSRKTYLHESKVPRVLYKQTHVKGDGQT